jgi:hypothetical protein
VARLSPIYLGHATTTSIVDVAGRAATIGHTCLAVENVIGIHILAIGKQVAAQVITQRLSFNSATTGIPNSATKPAFST